MTMRSIIRVESCHDLPVQDSGGGVQFCEFVGNMLVFTLYMHWPTSILLLAHFWKVNGVVGPFSEKLFS